MARTFNTHRRKHRKVTLCPSKRRKQDGGNLRRWENPFVREETTLVIIDSADEESEGRRAPLNDVLSVHDESAGTSNANAIEIHDSDTSDEEFQECLPHGAFNKSETREHAIEGPFDSTAGERSPDSLSSPRSCSATTSRGKPCSYLASKGEMLCPLHTRLSKKESSSRFKTRAKSPAVHETETDEAADTLFSGKKGQYRCIALSSRGQLCPYQSVNDTVYCYCHSDLSQKIFHEPSKFNESDSENGATGDSDNDAQQDSDNADSDSESSDEDGEGVARPYKFNEFERMWHDCEEYFGEMTDDIESTRRVRGANSKMAREDTDGQLKAQYGRLLPRAMKTLMKDMLKLSREDVFLDIGHGIGTACMQAAFTFGCESRGIEVVYDRNSVAEVFRDALVSQNNDNPNPRVVGKVFLRHGRLEDEQHLDFLTKGVTRGFVNNFNGVFAERSSKGNQKWFLDDYVSGIFACMSPGTILVTLHPLSLGPTRSEANISRKKQGLSESENSSFYEVEKKLLGKACDTVKWNQHTGNQNNIYLYKYTRTTQRVGSDAVFLCCNPSCPKAGSQIPIPATTKNEEGRTVINHCECKVTAKNLRRQRRKVYKDY